MGRAERLVHNVVEVHIANLRKKVDRDAESLLHTVRGVGYSIKS